MPEVCLLVGPPPVYAALRMSDRSLTGTCRGTDAGRRAVRSAAQGLFIGSGQAVEPWRGARRRRQCQELYRGPGRGAGLTGGGVGDGTRTRSPAD